MQQIIGSIASLIVIVIAIRFLLKRYQPPMILAAAGLVLMLVAILLGATPATILGKSKPTGFIGFDMYEFIRLTLSSRVAGLGLIIMSAGGFATYMDKIGASRALVYAMIKPLEALRSPYLVLAVAAIIGAALKVFIPSAAGLSMLLMVTIYPVIVALGVSRIAAAAMVITCGCFDIGPADGNTNLAANYSNLEVTTYYIKHQLPVACVGYLTLGVLHYFSARFLDKKEGVGAIYGNDAIETATGTGGKHDEERAPKAYLFLPTLPLVLLLVFSPYGIKGITVNVIAAMFISLTVGIICETIRRRDFKRATDDAMIFFDTMGKMFASVITLIVAGEIFARGLTVTGAVDMFIETAKGTGFGPMAMTITMTLFIVVSSVILGSGNASFFAFASLVPKIAADVGFSPVFMLLPMQIAAGASRVLSPITAVVVAVGGVAGISPFDVIKRTFIPGAGAVLTTTIAALIFS